MVDTFIVARNPVPTDTPEREATTEAAQAPAEASSALSSMAGQTTASVRGFIDRHWHDDIMADTRTPERMLSPDEFEKEYQLGPEHKPTGPISEYSAKSIAEAVKRRQAADMVWQRYSQAHSAPINMLTGMVGSMLDPIDAATLLVPGVGEERLTYALAKAGLGQKSAILAGKIGEGATGAMAGMAATMPIRYVANHDELYDYTAKEAFTELMFAAPLGAFMHAGLMPALGYSARKLAGAKTEPYFHDNYWPAAGGAPEDMPRGELKTNIRMGVAEAMRAADVTPPSIGYVDELAHMNAINRQIQHKSTFAQLLTERPVDNSWLFPDHTRDARRIAPEAHAEWDRLQREVDQLSAEHAWGKPPTPEEAASPEYRLEQRLREQTMRQLPVSWDLRVAADLQGHEAAPGAMYSQGAARARLEDVKPEAAPAFQVVDDKGVQHDLKASGDGKAIEFIADNAKVKIEKRPDGRWEVSWMTVEKPARGSGLMGKIYDAIEENYGIKMAPSGLLRKGGYDFWKKRSPESVKYHQQVADYGTDYHSPRFIKEQIAELQQDLARANAAGNKARAADIQEDMRAWQDAWRKVPPEGRSAEAIKAMYSFGGVRAKEQPKGLAAAVRMDRRGQRREDIWRETGWFKGETGRWRFEIDDSQAEILDSNFTRVPRSTRSVSAGTVGDVLKHDVLFNQYPDLKDIGVKVIVNPAFKQTMGGHFNHVNNEIYMEAQSMDFAKQGLIHELQHAIQAREGDIRLEPYYNTARAHTHPKFREIFEDLKAIGYTDSEAVSWGKHAVYSAMKIETESRIAEARLGMAPDIKKMLPPFSSYAAFPGYPVRIVDIVAKHMGRDLFDYFGYREYLRSDEFKARQAEIDARNARVRAALDERKAQVDNGYETADAKAKIAEEKARKAQEKLDAFMREHGADLEKQEKARLAAASAEADLFKANERLAKAKAEVAAYEREAAKHQKAVAEVEREKAMAQAILDDMEKERQARIKEERRRNPSAVEQGMADPNTRTAWISAMAKDPLLVAREESGHAIRASGLFKDEEWGILRDAAINKGWLDAMPKEIRERYEDAYASRGEAGARDAMVEEAIMHRFAAGPEAWGPQGGVVARLMERIRNLLERVGNWLTGRGFQSASDVLGAMDSGRISSRDTMQAHGARRVSEIEARMNELRPTILDAYKQAKEASHVDIPSIADAQRALWKRGFAHAATDNEVANMLERIYGPKTGAKAEPAKPGELPPELQVQEQRFQTMVEEGYRPTQEEAAEHAQTQAALQEAMALEQGYQQAAECLLMAGIP